MSNLMCAKIENDVTEREDRIYNVRLEGDIFDGIIIIEPNDENAEILASMFNNHPERLAMLVAAGEEGMSFRAEEID